MKYKKKPKFKGLESKPVELCKSDTALVDVEPNLFNEKLMQDQALISSALFSAMLYINELENRLKIKYHKDQTKEAITDPKAADYYNALTELYKVEAAYGPPGTTKWDKNEHKPWLATSFAGTLVEAANERNRFVKLFSELAGQTLEDLFENES